MATPPSTNISIVVPVYNEAGNLAPLADEIHAALEPLGNEYEVIFVDDGSTDGSPAELATLAEHPRVRVLTFAANAGQSAAFCAGFAASAYPAIATMDADRQNDPADLPALMARMTEGYDLVAGRRATRRDTASRRIASRAANAIRNALIGFTVSDTGCSLKVMRTDMARRLPAFNGMHRFIPNFFACMGARFAEADVNHRARTVGTSKYTNFDRALRGAWDLIGVAWLMRRFVTWRVRN